MNIVDKVFNENIIGITDPEKVDLGGLHYLYAIAFFLFFCLSFFLLEVSQVSNY